MLTEKDYCDYDTYVALKELGYKVSTSAYYMPKNSQLIFVINQFRGGAVMDCFYSNNSLPKECMASDFIDAPTMWEAQKWLREEKSIYVTVGCPLIMNEGLGWSYEVCDKPWNGHSDDDCVKASGGAYDSYEEALSEGIKGAVKILKEK